MPYTLNGCGTMYYGNRYPAEDGSYVTTLWVTFLWVPLLPLSSYRVRPVGKGTNYVVHQSQSYQTKRVPLCWPQVRNVLLFTVPILSIVLYFNASDIQDWWKRDIVKSNAPQFVLKPEPPLAQPAETDLPLDSKAAAVACGKVMKLDKSAFAKLDLFKRLSQLAVDNGVTNKELTALGGSDREQNEQIFQAYALGYLTWDKSNGVSRADFDEIAMRAVHSADKFNLSSDERAQLDAYFVKYKRTMVGAFDLGRHDARMSPCPFKM